MVTTFLKIVFACIFPLLLLACGPIGRIPKAVSSAVTTVIKAPEENEADPLIVEEPSLWLVGSDNINSLNDKARPVVVRVYQLKTKDAFEMANFVDIYQNDAKALGPALISKNVFSPLYPSERRKVEFELDKEAAYIAAFVEYVDYNARKDRAVLPIVNGQIPNTLYIQVTDKGPSFVDLNGG